MTRRVACLTVAMLLAFTMEAQHPKRPNDPDEPVRLPNGKLQQDELLKADHEKDASDSRELARLSAELRDEIEKGDAHVLSITALKKTEDIEKLAKRIRARIKHY